MYSSLCEETEILLSRAYPGFLLEGIRQQKTNEGIIIEISLIDLGSHSVYSGFIAAIKSEEFPKNDLNIYTFCDTITKHTNKALSKYRALNNLLEL